MPPFSVVCFDCAPKDLEFLKEHNSMYQQKIFFWGLKIKIRDKHKCRICDALNLKKKDKLKLQAHHIFPIDLFPELQFIVDNGITLCSLHHKSLHTKQFERIKEVITESIAQENQLYIL